MTAKLIFRIGIDLAANDREILADVEAAVAAADRGESFEPKRIIGFESWSGFFRCMTPNRIALLKYIAAHDQVASTRALSIALSRDYSAVHADVAELVKLGLIERDGTVLRCEIEPDQAELVAA